MGLIGLNSEEQTWLDFPNRLNKKYKIYNINLLAVETLTSIGYGDITPVNTYEIFITDLALFGQMFIIVYTVSYIASLQDQQNPFDKNFLAIKKFMKIKKISKDLNNQVSIFQNLIFKIQPYIMKIEKTKVDPLKLIRDVIEEVSEKQKRNILFLIPTIPCSSLFVDYWNYFVFINTLILFNIVPLIIFFYKDYDSFKLNPIFKSCRYYLWVFYFQILFYNLTQIIISLVH